MKNLLSPFYQSTARRFLGGIVGLSLMAVPALQAQTNFDFNASTAPGWDNWLPEMYTYDSGDPWYTNGACQASVTFVTNPISAGNMAYKLHSGTTNGEAWMVGSFITNGTPLNNFTMTVDLINWTNGQSQAMGLVGRALLPWSPINQPGSVSLSNSWSGPGLMLNYHNNRSANEYRGVAGGKDYIRIHYMTPLGARANLLAGDFNHPGTYMPGDGRILGKSTTATNGHYRLILTANDYDITAQMVDLSDGLAMTTGGSDPGPAFWAGGYLYNTNILRTSALVTRTVAGVVYQMHCTNNGAIYTNGTLAEGVVAAGGTFGLTASPADGGYTFPAQPSNPLYGQPVDPTFDNFAVVPGVVTLESAAAVNGPYTQNLRAGIEVSPKRITVATPASGNQQFYRIKWIGCDHIPTITSATFNGNVTVVDEVPGVPYYTIVTNVVKKLVLTYN